MTETDWQVLRWIGTALWGVITIVAGAVWWFRGQTKDAEIRGLRQENTAIKEQLKGHEAVKAGEIAGLKTSIDGLKEQIKAVETAKAGEIAGLREQISSLREQIKTHEAWRAFAEDHTKKTTERLTFAEATIVTLRGQIASGAPKEALVTAATASTGAVYSAIASNTVVASALDPEFQSTPPSERLAKLQQSEKHTAINFDALIEIMGGKNVAVSKHPKMLDEATSENWTEEVEDYAKAYKESFRRAGVQIYKLPSVDRDTFKPVILLDDIVKGKP